VHGELIPVEVRTFGLGGAVSIKYNCNGCGKYEAHFEAFSSVSPSIPETGWATRFDSELIR
jgi:uncharacterized ParB-like nuclease family protein